MSKKVRNEWGKLRNSQAKDEEIVKLARRLLIIESKMINSPNELSEAELEEYTAKFLEFCRSDAGTPCPGCYVNQHNAAVPGADHYGSAKVQ